MSRDYSNYHSYYQPDPPRYYYPDSTPRSRWVPPPPPPPPPPRQPTNSQFRQTQQFWRSREDAPPVVPERHSHRRYRLEEPRRDRDRHRDRDRDRRSSEVPANVSRHRSMVPATAFDPAAFLFANLFQSLFSDDDEFLPSGMVIVGRSFPFPSGVHIRLFGIVGEPEDEEPVGLDQRAIERIPVLTYRKSSSRRSANDDKCAVCLTEFDHGDKVRRLKCQHYFHVDCIDPWLKTSTVCPICRGEQN